MCWEANRWSYRFESSSPSYKRLSSELFREFVRKRERGQKEKAEKSEVCKIREGERLRRSNPISVSMVSREHKRAALYEKLQLLRSITNSHAVIPLLHSFLRPFLYSIGLKLLSVYMLYTNPKLFPIILFFCIIYCFFSL